MAKRFVLFDSALEGLGGHYLGYARCTLDAASAEGYATFLVTRRDVTVDGLDHHEVIPALTTDFWTSFVSVAGGVSSLLTEIIGAAARARDVTALEFSGAGLVRAVARKLALGCFIPLTATPVLERRWTTRPLRRLARIFADDLKIVSQRLGGIGPDDVLFLPTVFVVEPMGLDLFLAEHTVAAAAAWRLLYRRDLDVEQKTSRAMLSLRRHRLGNALKALSRRPHVRFFTDTPRLTDRYDALSAATFTTAPIPVEAPHKGRESAAPPLNVVFLGGACVEKGFHHLVGVVECRPPDHRAKYIFQANFSTSPPESICVEARAKLEGIEGVQLVEGPLGTKDYQALLSNADIVLLPYDPVAYRARSSGVFTEALAAGIPVVATAGTWMASCLASEALDDGAGWPGSTVTAEDRALAGVRASLSARGGLTAKPNAAAIAHALETVIENYELFLQASRNFAPRWSRRHSAGSLVSELMALGSSIGE